MLDPSTQAIRLRLLNYGIEHEGTIPWKMVLKESEKALADTPDSLGRCNEEILRYLEDRHYFRRDEEGDICYLYPLSLYPTAYHVTLKDGRSFYAMCAIDAMGSAVTFDMPVAVRSCCRDTDEDVYLELDPENGLTEARVGSKPDHDIYATYFDVNARYIDFNC